MSNIKVYTSSTSSNLKFRTGTERVKAILAAIGVNPEIIYADLMDTEERQKVWDISGQKGVYPLVFCGDKYIGTDEEIEYANEDGELKALLGL